MKEEEKSIFPQKCQKIRGETTDCIMNSEGLKQGLKAFFYVLFYKDLGHSEIVNHDDPAFVKLVYHLH